MTDEKTITEAFYERELGDGTRDPFVWNGGVHMVFQLARTYYMLGWREAEKRAATAGVGGNDGR